LLDSLLVSLLLYLLYLPILEMQETT